MTFRFANETSELGPDKMIVMIDADENVVVRRVIDVVSEDRSSFEVTVTVADDSILNIFDRASIRGHYSNLSNFPDLEVSVQELGGVAGLTGKLDAQGNIESTTHFGLTIENNEIKKTFFKIESQVSTELVDTFTYQKNLFSYDASKQIWDGPSKSVPVGSIGPIPIIIELDVNLDAGLSGRADVVGELEVGFSMAPSATLTVESEGDKITRSDLEFGGLNFAPIGPNWKFDGTVNNQAFLVPQLDVLVGVKGVGGLAGVTFSLRPYLEFQGEFEQALNETTDLTRYHWALYGGYDSDVKMKVEGLDGVDLPEAKFGSRRIKLLEDCYPLETESELAIMTSKGPPNSLDQVFFVEADEIDLEAQGDCIGILSQIQWYKDGLLLPGATNLTLNLPAYLDGREGQYDYTIVNLLNPVQDPLKSKKSVELVQTKLSLVAVGGADMTIKSFESYVSLNNESQVAFVGRPTGAIQNESIYVGSGETPARSINNGTRMSRFLQLNDEGVVVGRDQRSSGLSITISVRKWKEGQPLINVARSGVSSRLTPVVLPGLPFPIFTEEPVNLSEFDVVVTPSMNNLGQVAFVGNGGPPGQLHNALVYSKGSSMDASEQVLLALLPGGIQSSTRPMIADDGTVLVRLDTEDGPGPILAYRRTGDLDFSPDVIASTEGENSFSQLGRMSGISDDGQAIAFYGYHPTQAAPGVFAFIDAFDARFAVAVDSFNTTGRSISIQVIDNERVNINRLNFLEEEFVYRTLYRATSDNGIVGLYYSDIQILPPSPEDPEKDRVRITGPFLVIEIGDSVAGVSGKITDFSIHDSLNTWGEVAFWMITDGGQEAIVRADGL